MFMSAIYNNPLLKFFKTTFLIYTNLSNYNSPQFFVRLDYIRKCFTQKGGIFILEEFSKFSVNSFLSFI